MNDQLGFWPEPESGKARWSDPETSHQAAEKVDATRLEVIVAAAIRRAGPRGLIAAELPEHTGLALNTVTPRTRPLCMKGIIFDSGRKRLGPTNKQQIVWVHEIFRKGPNGKN
jgi:hypothetical protein